MLVKDLMEKLKTLPQDYLVVMSSDPEGNGYMKLGSIDIGSFRGSDFGLLPEQLTIENLDLGYSEEDVYTDGTPSVCFWPL